MISFINWLFNRNKHIWITDNINRTCLSCGRREYSHYLHPQPSDWLVDNDWAFDNNISIINEKNKNVCKN